MNLERVVADLAETVERRFLGKYRGFVVDNQDPARLGRLRVKVPSVLGEDVVTGWAAPCVPYGGVADAGLLFVPELESGVWVEFEEGDLEFPIWVGAYWSTRKEQDGVSGLPRPGNTDDTDQDEVQQTPTRKIIRTSSGHTIQFEDADGEEIILIRDKGRNTIVMGADGIRIRDATGNTIEMTSEAFTLTAKVPFTIDAAGQPVKVVAKTVDFEKG